jgi:hypothetical protein
MATASCTCGRVRDGGGRTPPLLVSAAVTASVLLSCCYCAAAVDRKSLDVSASITPATAGNVVASLGGASRCVPPHGSSCNRFTCVWAYLRWRRLRLGLETVSGKAFAPPVLSARSLHRLRAYTGMPCPVVACSADGATLRALQVSWYNDGYSSKSAAYVALLDDAPQ